MRAWEVGFVWNLKPASSQRVLLFGSNWRKKHLENSFLRLAIVSQNRGGSADTPGILGCLWDNHGVVWPLLCHLWSELICRDRDLGEGAQLAEYRRGGGSTETEMGGRRKKRVQENWTPWELLGACSGQVQRKARREKGKGRYPRLRPAQTHMKEKSKLWQFNALILKH